ncbi:hypothetical protein C8J57DRAFT_1399907 [Mycena rebaudengoi]|nr:hypothetical protein C8J57DRAFT_1399907 [Mycena rebaudengoi]
MGDLDFRAEIYRNLVVVHRRGKQASARRIYSARVRGIDSNMTAAVYQGNNAEEEWREDVRRLSWLRHPSFVQIYATASASGIHAAVFHDDLVPARAIFKKHCRSHFAIVYLRDQLETEFSDAMAYYTPLCTETYLRVWNPFFDCTMWIRCSTGHLCIELTPNDDLIICKYSTGPLFPCTVRPSSLFEPPDDSQIIEAISMHQYHAVCSSYLGCVDIREVPIHTSVRLGTMVYMPASCKIAQEVSGLSDPCLWDWGWLPCSKPCQLLENGWTRVIPSDSPHTALQVISRDILGSYDDAWLAQANHIFDCAQIPSKYSDYGLTNRVTYWLLPSDEKDIPHGYLFLCPLQDLQGNSLLEFIYPACPAYWSLDPSGAQRLDEEEATGLGFPSFTLRMSIWTTSWDDLVYAGVRKFHQAKGFDPYSQDVAREFGCPLFEVCAHETEVPDDQVPTSAYCEEVTSHEPTESNQSSNNIDDADLREPTVNWKLFMGAQLAGIIISTLFSLCECCLL